MSDSDSARADVPVLRLTHVAKHFGGVTAVEEASLEVHQGEVVALVGNNGAGKSTIMRMIFGLHPPDSGQIEIAGEQVRFRGPRDAREWGIEPVPQELALASQLSVAANIFLGREITRGVGPFRMLNKKAMRDQAKQRIGEFGIHIPNFAGRVFDMSGGQQQAVAIGRAMVWGGRLIVLDEPTAALGIHETNQVEDTIRSMRQSRVAVMLVSHDLDQVFRVADRVYVLRRGRLVGQRRVRETNEDEVVGMITGTQAADEHEPQTDMGAS
jgi:ABC-type sugar transport system ATPase subunit